GVAGLDEALPERRASGPLVLQAARRQEGGAVLPCRAGERGGEPQRGQLSRRAGGVHGAQERPLFAGHHRNAGGRGSRGGWESGDRRQRQRWGEGGESASVHGVVPPDPGYTHGSVGGSAAARGTLRE